MGQYFCVGGGEGSQPLTLISLLQMLPGHLNNDLRRDFKKICKSHIPVGRQLGRHTLALSRCINRKSLTAVLEGNKTGSFYYTLHREAEVAGNSNAWQKVGAGKTVLNNLNCIANGITTRKLKSLLHRWELAKGQYR